MKEIGKLANSEPDFFEMAMNMLGLSQEARAEVDTYFDAMMCVLITHVTNPNNKGKYLTFEEISNRVNQQYPDIRPLIEKINKKAIEIEVETVNP